MLFISIRPVSATQQTQIVAFAILVIGAIVWLWWMMHNRRQWLYAVPPLSWTGHALSFYLVIFARDFFGLVPPGTNLTLWSAVLRLHAAFLIMGIGLAMILEKIIITRANGHRY